MPWNTLNRLQSRAFRCGFCGERVASDIGYFSDEGSQVYICPHCACPTFFDRQQNQQPGVSPGNDVQHVPETLRKLYREARDCCSVSAFTASVLCSRKMLMNIGVDHGAKEGLSFIQYIEYLSDKGFIPPNGKGWVDHIRKKGNEATHEIAVMAEKDAEELIAFTEMLLKFIYEFPAKVPGPAQGSPARKA